VELKGFPIELRPAALRAIRELDVVNQTRINKSITALSFDARPSGSKRIRSRAGYRIGVGEYEILYTVDVEANFVSIVTVLPLMGFVTEASDNQLN
jgi:mRNA interferase RelE/StbE